MNHFIDFLGSIPGLERSPGEGNFGNPLQYSCLGTPMDRGAQQAIVHGVTKEQHMPQRQNTHTHRFPLEYKILKDIVQCTNMAFNENFLC